MEALMAAAFAFGLCAIPIRKHPQLHHLHPTPSASALPRHPPLMTTPSLTFKKKASCRISCGMFFHPKVPNVTGATFIQLVAKSDIPVLVTFYCDLHSVFGELLFRRVYAIAERYDGRLKCFVVNVDSEEKLAEYFGIEEVPTIMMFKNAKVFGDPFVGVVEDEDVIYKAIEELLA